MRLINAMFRVFKKIKKQKDIGHNRYVEDGNLRIGENSDVKYMKVHIQDKSNGYLNIEIGRDCYILGTISLYSSKARIKIGDRVFIGPDTTLFCYDAITIDDDVMISWGCTLIDTNAHSLNSVERKNDVVDWLKGPSYKDWSVVESKEIHIQSKCWIGFNNIIMKGVTMGEGSVIAAGSVVTKSTSPFGVYGGNPATFIKSTS